MKESARNDRIGLVSPDIPLLSNLTVFDNILLVPRFLTKQKDDEIQSAVSEALSLLGILDLKAKKPSEIDGRSLFKVKLLRALFFPDSTTVLDRPFLMLSDIADFKPINEMFEALSGHIDKILIVDCKWRKNGYQAQNFEIIEVDGI